MRQVFARVGKILAFSLSIMLGIATIPHAALSQASEGYNGQGARLTPAELNALVAPIALYPDALVAQVVGAATFARILAYRSCVRENRLASFFSAEKS